MAKAPRPRLLGFGPNDRPKKLCPACGAAFFTGVGLDAHVDSGCAAGTAQPVTVRRVWQFTEARQAAMKQRGQELTAEMNARCYRCAECDLESTPAGLSLHQRATGHTGVDRRGGLSRSSNARAELVVR